MISVRDEFIGWIKTHTKELFTYTLSKVQQKEVAEDLVQDTFIAAYQAYDKFQRKSNEKTWLFSILKRKIADYYRNQYKKAAEVPSGITSGFFDENDRWKHQFRPQDWGNEKELLDDPEFEKAL